MKYNLPFCKALSLLLVGLLACSKKDDPTAGAPAIRLFSHGAEIMDVAVKSRFLAQHMAAFAPLTAIADQKIVLNAAADTAWFAPSTMPFRVVKNGSQYLFYSPQLVELSASDTPFHNLQRYVAPKVLIPCGGRSLGGCYLTEEVRVGVRAGQWLTLSYMQYCRSITTYYPALDRTYYWQGVLYNELSESGAPQAVGTDTLAVRSATISLPVL